jgi:HNH endonuclease
VTRLDELRAQMDAYVAAALEPCWYCGVGQVEIREHVTPRSRGGTDDPGNIVWSCRSCNVLKGPRTLEEFRALISGRLGVESWLFWGER